VEPHEVDMIIRHLAAAIEHQRTIHDDVRIAIQDQHGIHERLTTAIERIDAAIERLDMTQACIETLLVRMIQQSENGREA
jgi:Holliday junction resolvasome RuvABC endonuclease subunit